MRHAPSSPIGKTWTRILLWVDQSGRLTTRAVARLYAGGSGQPVEGRALNTVSHALRAMQLAGWLTRVAPHRPGEQWTTTLDGVDLVRQIKQARQAPRRPKAIYRTEYHRRKYAKERRAKARGAGRCVNENAQGTHGPATHGCRCQACDITWKASARSSGQTAVDRVTPGMPQRSHAVLGDVHGSESTLRPTTAPLAPRKDLHHVSSRH